MSHDHRKISSFPKPTKLLRHIYHASTIFHWSFPKPKTHVCDTVVPHLPAAFWRAYLYVTDTQVLVLYDGPKDNQKASHVLVLYAKARDNHIV